MRTTILTWFIVAACLVLAVSALEIVEPVELSGITLSTPSVGDNAFNLDEADLVFVQGVCSQGYVEKNNGKSNQPHGKPQNARSVFASSDSVWTKRNEQQNNNSPHGNNGNNNNNNGNNNNNNNNGNNGNNGNNNSPQGNSGNNGNNGNNGGNNGNSDSPHGNNGNNNNNGNNGNNGNNNNNGSNNNGNNGNNNSPHGNNGNNGNSDSPHGNNGNNGNNDSPHGKPPQAGGSNNNPNNDAPHGKPPNAGPKNPNNEDPEESPGSENVPTGKKRGKPPQANPNSDKTKKNNNGKYSDIEPVGQSFEDPALNLTGKIVVTSFKGCSSLQQAWNAEQAGAVAIIIAVEGEPGYGKFKKQDTDAGITVSIPIFEISNDDFNTLADYSSQAASTLVVALPADDPNPWESVSNDGLINLFTIAMILFSAAVISFGLVKWILLFKHNSRRQLIVPSIMIVFEIISAVFRAVYAGDPLNMRGIYSYLESSVLQQLPNAFWYMATVAICFFWIDNVLKPSSSIPRKFVWLSKTRYAFIGIGVLFIGVDLTVGLLRGLNKENRTIVLASGVVYATITALLAIAFIVLGVLVLRAIKRVEGLSFFKKEIVQKQTRFLILNGFSMISMAVLHVLLIDFILDPISYYAGLFTLWSLMTLSSCSVLMMINPKPAANTVSKERSMSTASTGKTSSAPSTPRTMSTTIDSFRSSAVDNV